MSATQTNRTYGGSDVMGIRSFKVTFKYSGKLRHGPQFAFNLLSSKVRG